MRLGSGLRRLLKALSLFFLSPRFVAFLFFIFASVAVDLMGVDWNGWERSQGRAEEKSVSYQESAVRVLDYGVYVSIVSILSTAHVREDGALVGDNSLFLGW